MAERNKSFCTTSNAQILPVTIAANGTFSVPGVAGQSISVLYIALSFSVAGTVALGHGAAPAAWSGAIPVAANQTFVVDHHDNPLVTAAGEQFIITCAGSAAGAGYVMITQGNA